MAFRFFTVPIQNAEQAEAELNGLLFMDAFPVRPDRLAFRQPLFEAPPLLFAQAEQNLCGNRFGQAIGDEMNSAWHKPVGQVASRDGFARRHRSLSRKEIERCAKRPACLSKRSDKRANFPLH